MFSYIKGTIEAKDQDYIVLETGGIGYKIFMSQTSIEKLEDLGTKKKIYTYLRVREDDVSIYGFVTEEELRMFELLLGVSGIGAKGAVSILSNITLSSFALAVISDDVAKIKSLPGIGAKTAQRIILELKDKLKTTSAISNESEDGNKLEEIVAEDSKFAEATAALQVLGYTRKEIEKALNKIDASLTVEEIIKKGLNNLARQ
jgi:Holliday junction DNA helicase RuvA